MRLEECKSYPNYFISDDGQLYTKYIKGGQGKLGEELRPVSTKIDRYGYVSCVLAVAPYITAMGKVKRVKYTTVHRLVAEQYLPTWDTSLQVNHKNMIKTDNRVDNLEMVTGKENVNHMWRMLPDKIANCSKIITVFDHETNNKYVFKSMHRCNHYIPELSLPYLRELSIGKANRYARHYVMRTDGTLPVIVYFNGQEVLQKASLSELAHYYGKAPNTLSQKANNPLDTKYWRYTVTFLNPSTIESVSVVEILPRVSE